MNKLLKCQIYYALGDFITDFQYNSLYIFNRSQQKPPSQTDTVIHDDEIKIVDE